MTAPLGTIRHRRDTDIDEDHKIPLIGDSTTVQAGEKSLKIP